MRPAALIAAVTTGFHLATANIYGYHRDEFYYLAQGRRLSWGYVDNPPVTPFLYRVSDTLFGSSQFGLRILPAVLHGVLVILTALIARELGGNTRAQTLAALGAAIAPMFLTTGHFLGTVTPEVVAGATTTLFVVRVLRTGDTRWWIAAGIALGLGILDHWTIGTFAIALVAGLLLTPQRELLVSRDALLGVAVAVLIAVPNVVWQARHDWPQVTFAKQLRDYGHSLQALPAQFFLLGAASVLLALPGLLWLLRNDTARPYRGLGYAFLLTLALVTITGGKEYYTGAALPLLLGAGGAALAGTSGWVRPALLFGIGALMVPFATPVLPLSTANTVRGVNKEIGEMVGWSEFVDTVVPIARAHPDAPILTSNYSEAGSVELLGTPRGVRQPVSGHLNYWLWAHPHGISQETIAIGFSRPELERYFGDVQPVATIVTPHGVDNEENGALGVALPAATRRLGHDVARAADVLSVRTDRPRALVCRAGCALDSRNAARPQGSRRRRRSLHRSTRRDQRGDAPVGRPRAVLRRRRGVRRSRVGTRAGDRRDEAHGLRRGDGGPRRLAVPHRVLRDRRRQRRREVAADPAGPARRRLAVHAVGILDADLRRRRQVLVRGRRAEHAALLRGHARERVDTAARDGHAAAASEPRLLAAKRTVTAAPDALAQTVDYITITRLQHAYADVVNRRDWPELAELFRPDAPVRVDTVTNPVVDLAGPDAIGTFIGGAIERFSFFEFVVLNARVYLDGNDDPDTARARVFMCELRQDRETGEFSRAFGVYHDHYRRLDGRWWFARRRYQSLARTGGEVFEFPKEAW